MWASSEQDYLSKINLLIDDRLRPIAALEINESENILHHVCRHLCVSEHAKRVRPLVCLYYHGLFSDEIPQNFLNLGVAAEFIHAASLLHDDIVDEADQRRGKSSANRMFGNATAVLAGDYLLSEAFSLLKPFERALTDRAIFVVREMTKAAILELNIRGNVEVTTEILKKVAVGKTGLLFSFCGFATATLCKNTDAQETLWNIGERIGLIFQLADDLKDFDGDKNLKDVCRDLRNFEPSMPILLAMQKNEKIKTIFKTAHSDGAIDEETVSLLKDLIISTGAILATKDMVNQEIDYVMTALRRFEGTIAKKRLDEFVQTLCP